MPDLFQPWPPAARGTATTNWNNNWRGHDVTPTRDLWVTHLSVFPSSSISGGQAAVWRVSGGVKLAHVLIDSKPTAQNTRTDYELATPVKLVANERYYIGGRPNAGGYHLDSGNGHGTTPYGTSHGMRYENGTGVDAFPGQFLTGQQYGYVNAIVSETDPSGVAGGLAALGGRKAGLSGGIARGRQGRGLYLPGQG